MLELGLTLHEWLRDQRTMPSIVSMFYDVASQLVRLHSMDLVHRDLKCVFCFKHCFNITC